MKHLVLLLFSFAFLILSGCYTAKEWDIVIDLEKGTIEQTIKGVAPDTLIFDEYKEDKDMLPKVATLFYYFFKSGEYKREVLGRDIKPEESWYSFEVVDSQLNIRYGHRVSLDTLSTENKIAFFQSYFHPMEYSDTSFIFIDQADQSFFIESTNGEKMKNVRRFFIEWPLDQNRFSISQKNPKVTQAQCYDMAQYYDENGRINRKKVSRTIRKEMKEIFSK